MENLPTPQKYNHRLTSSKTSSLVLMGAGWLKPSSSSSFPNMRGEGEEEEELDDEEEEEEELSLRTGERENQSQSFVSIPLLLPVKNFINIKNKDEKWSKITMSGLKTTSLLSQHSVSGNTCLNPQSHRHHCPLSYTH